MVNDLTNNWRGAQFPNSTIGWGGSEKLEKAKSIDYYLTIIKAPLIKAGINNSDIIIKQTIRENSTADSNSTEIFIKSKDGTETNIGVLQDTYLTGAKELNNKELVTELLEKFSNQLVEKHNNPSLPTPTLTTNLTLLYQDSAYSEILEKNPPSGLQQQTQSCDISNGQQKGGHGCGI